MNGFSFLEPGLPLQIDRALAAGKRHAIPLLATVVCIAVSTGTWLVERERLQVALVMQSSYQARFDASKRNLIANKASLQRMLDAVALDRQIRHIRASGVDDARRMTQVANAIPEHAWLRSVVRAAGSLQIEGSARDLTAVSRVMRNLTNESGLANPTLKTASLTDDRAGAQIRYELDVQTP